MTLLILNTASRKLKTTLCLLLALAALSGFTAKPAQACGACLDCGTWYQAVADSINNHESWFSGTYWQDYWLPTMKKFTDQFTQVMMLHARMVGGFMDGQNQLRSQLVLQEMSADALKSYTPSESVCQFGTLSRSLAASQAKSRNAQIMMSERFMARELGKSNSSGAKGIQGDRLARLEAFQKRYCDKWDNSSGRKDVPGMATLCKSGGPDKFHNVDINYTRMIDTRPTLDIDLSNATATDDEKDVMAMSSNLYSQELSKRFPTADIQDATGNKDNRSILMEMRAISAKRNVAQHSFNTVIGMKAAGSKASRDYVFKVLENLGMTATDAKRFFADTSTSGAVSKNPSYSVQMDILTKRLYQDPAFYANLMDKPANVQRQFAAMQSFGLMQQRDVFESVMRSEMLLSLIVEMEVLRQQDSAQNRLNPVVK